MLSGKNPSREMDFSDARERARHGPLETSRRNVLVGGAAVRVNKNETHGMKV
jgi:hypothetical protein